MKRDKAYISIKPVENIQGEIAAPPDKSISHRAIIISSIAKGKTEVENFLICEDCLHTVSALQQLGIKITIKKGDRYSRRFDFLEGEGNRVVIEGKGLLGLKAPSSSLYVGNSGTTMRLLSGVLAGQDFECSLTGNASLSRRPMGRITQPLRLMGASIFGKKLIIKGGVEEEYAPLTIKGGRLKAINYRLPIPSAQVKSALLLAGLYAQGRTSIIEPTKSRDHTERMLRLFGANIRFKAEGFSLEGPQRLFSPSRIEVPGDISSASFFLVAAAILPGSNLVIRRVGLNPTRTGIIDVLKRMGAKIQISKLKQSSDYSEAFGDIAIESGKLKGVTIQKQEIPRLIDELPILMVAASCAQGETTIKGAEELRVKETDRINSMVANLKKLGADILSENDKVIIRSKGRLRAAKVDSFGDHRTAMAMIVAGLAAKERILIGNISCINKSFPNFLVILKELTKRKRLT